MARLKPSRISTPRPAPGPEKLEHETYLDLVGRQAGLSGDQGESRQGREAIEAHGVVLRWNRKGRAC